MKLKGLVSDSDNTISHIGDEGGRKSDKRKQSLYFPADVVEEMEKEAKRLDRSLSWVVQRAWKLAKEEVRNLPTVNDIDAAAE